MDCSEEAGSLMNIYAGVFNVAETAFLVLAEIQKDPRKGGVSAGFKYCTSSRRVAARS